MLIIIEVMICSFEMVIYDMTSTSEFLVISQMVFFVLVNN